MTDEKGVARDFIYIEDMVKRFLGALDTMEKSTRSGEKRASMQLKKVVKMVSILEGLLNVKSGVLSSFMTLSKEFYFIFLF